MEPCKSRCETMRPSDQGLTAKLLGLPFERRWFIRQEAVQSAIDLRGREERTNRIVDEIRGMERDKMWMRQLPQPANFVQHLLCRKEVRCATNLNLRAQVHATYRASEHNFIGGVIPALDTIVRRCTHNLYRNAFVLRVFDVLAFANPTHQIPPLSMEELRVECGIVPHGRETQSIHVLFGDREIVVIARLVDECKDAVGNANGIEN